jgi:hypothetical protein
MKIIFTKIKKVVLFSLLGFALFPDIAEALAPFGLDLGDVVYRKLELLQPGRLSDSAIHAGVYIGFDPTGATIHDYSSQNAGLSTSSKNELIAEFIDKGFSTPTLKVDKWG